MVELIEPISVQPAVVGSSASPLQWLRDRTDVRVWPLARRFLFVLCVIYLAKQAFNVFIFPPFSGHDEVAHYAYLRTVATEHRVPVLPNAAAWIASGNPDSIPSGDLIPDELYKYCNYILGWQGVNVCEIDNPAYVAKPPRWRSYSQGLGPQLVGYQYAANHPPLTYVIMTPLYWLSEGATPETQLYLIRAAMIPFGLLTVLFAYLTTRTLFPNDTFLAITVPAFVAFQPQVSYEAAMVNNDIVCIAVYSWILYLLVVGIRDKFPTKICVLTGFAFGIALLVKGTSLTAAPLIALAIILGVGLLRIRLWVVKGAITAAIAGVFAFPWYLYLYRTYGNLDAFDQISALQWFNYWGRERPTFMELFWNKGFVLERWNETWGMFGWRRLPLNMTWLWTIGIPHIVALVGLVVYLGIANRSRLPWVGRDLVLRPSRWQTYALLLLLATCVLAYFAIIQFGLRFTLTQARYYFPAINAVAILLMLGLRTLIPRRWHNYGQAAVLIALVVMNVMIYSQYVVPYRLEGWV